ncbi:hypothetical protein K435DRAFT_800321 [Dendrothele bispora CBS 962.96]|uniref:Uncharacterized protein n=1 Tax=Dendrothele bispora (strain CBS 962.96) TaxID=1314807 RepID=A0A4S8LUG4_DENBC|nr:hypothetical protein K435DRAFT_800321 [Dendrothele bispora CBS 962.96]
MDIKITKTMRTELLSSKLTDDSDVFHMNFLNQYMNEDGHLGHLITGDSWKGKCDPLTRIYQSVLTGKGEACKAVTPVYAYQGTGSPPPITWSFHQVWSHQYWTQLTKEQQEKKTITVTKQTEKKYVVGPLDFCGTAVVVNHGNG